jgi:hypothetical protein
MLQEQLTIDYFQELKHNQKPSCYKNVWDAIFRDYKWLSIVYSKSYDPMLIGYGLHNLYMSDLDKKATTHLILSCGFYHGSKLFEGDLL